MAGVADDPNGFDVFYGDNVDFSGGFPPSAKVLLNGQLLVGSTATPHIQVGNLTSPTSSVLIGYSSPNITVDAGSTVATTYTANSGTATPSANNLNVFTLGESNTTASGNTINVFAPRVAKWVVDPTPNKGTHTTIGTALISANPGDTIFIRPGTYTENLTLVAGVNLTSFPSEYQGGTTSQVNIVGKLTCTFSGTVSISGVTLQTNSDNVITSSGSNTGTLRLTNCNLFGNNNTLINSSNANFTCLMFQCIYVLNTTGITLATFTGGNLGMFFVRGQNPGTSSTASTFAASQLTANYCEIQTPVTTSTTGGVALKYSIINNGATNATCITAGGSGTTVAEFCEFQAGSASAISIGASMTMTGCLINSSNTNAITGAGTLIYTDLYFTGTSNTINTTTVTRNVVDGGTYKGQNTNTAIPAGMIGEEIRSAVASGSAVSINNASPTNITSIALTAGVWEISGIISITGSLTGTVFACSVNTTSATLGTQGDNRVDTPSMPTSSSHISMSVPSWRQLFSGNQTVWLVAQVNFTVGTCTGYGRISAVRVA